MVAWVSSAGPPRFPPTDCTRSVSADGEGSRAEMAAGNRIHTVVSCFVFSTRTDAAPAFAAQEAALQGWGMMIHAMR